MVLGAHLRKKNVSTQNNDNNSQPWGALIDVE